MKITVLSDNIGSGEFQSEWGLSLHIEYEGKRFLLDMGASDAFLKNAEKLGIDISKVDFAIISHAHFDHTRGLKAFLDANPTAPVYLSPNAEENCYAGLGFLSKYIGMPKGLTAAYPERIKRPEGIVEISEGVFLVPHSTEGLSKLGQRNHLLVKRGCRYLPDDFSHEQTLVFKTNQGLVLLNSCSHSGPEIIVDEVKKVFPEFHLRAYLGGLHLFRLTETEVKAVAERLSACGIDTIYTGHCTGENAYHILRDHFADRIHQFHCGMQIDF